MNIDDFIDTYSQLIYSLEFEARRKNGDKNLEYPIPF